MLLIIGAGGQISGRRWGFFSLSVGQFLIEFLNQIGVSPPFDLHLLHTPYYLLATLFTNFRTALFITLAQPLFHTRELLSPGMVETAVFIAVSIIPGVGIITFKEAWRRKNKHLRESLDRIQRGAEGLMDTGPELGRERILSEYISFTEERERNLLDLLIMAEKSIAADSANLFLIEDGRLSFSLSSLQEDLFVEEGGLIQQVINTRRPVFCLAEKEREIVPGYNREGLMSFIATPVKDGETLLGVLSADSNRYRAFDQKDLDLLEMFGTEVSKLLHRQRMLARIDLEYRSLRILYQESARYGEILDLDEVSNRIIKGAQEISGASAILFLKEERGYKVIPPVGKDRITRWKGTLLANAIDTGQAIYRSDLSKDSLPPLPPGCGNSNEIGSIIFIPMFHEEETVGILVVYSEKRDAFTSHLFELLRVLANQASLSISNAILHQEIKTLALTDGLTGLYNHRHFQERLAEEFKKAERFSEPLSLILTDIDHFKRVNDTYGHPAGDVVLKGFSRIIRETVREIDIPARYGGEEFAIMALKADAPEAKKIAERIRKRVQKERFQAEGVEINVTVSLGIASYPRDASSREELIEHADQSLYRAKESGRNRTVLFREMKHG